MTATELFPTLRNLPRADKLKVMQFLITELAKEENLDLQSGMTYSLWSPLNSHEAAPKLAQLCRDGLLSAKCVMLKDLALRKALIPSVFQMRFPSYH